MSTSYLLNTVRYGQHLYKPGTKLDSALDPTAGIQAAGGMLWPSADTVVAAAALLAQAAGTRGGELDEMQGIMFGAAFASLQSAASGSGASDVILADAGGYFSTDNVEAALQAIASGSAGNGVGILKKTATIDFTTDAFSGLAGGVKTFDKNVGTALPANARIVSVTAETVTDFDDAAHGTYVVVIGTSAGGNQVGTSLNVAAGQSGFPKIFTAGAQGYLMAPQGTAQLAARLTSSVDLNTVTAGHVVLNAFYVIQA